jgi:hypothetical protein
VSRGVAEALTAAAAPRPRGVGTLQGRYREPVPVVIRATARQPDELSSTRLGSTCERAVPDPRAPDDDDEVPAQLLLYRPKGGSARGPWESCRSSALFAVCRPTRVGR